MDFASWTCWLKNQFWRLTVVQNGISFKQTQTKNTKKKQTHTDKQTNKQTNKQSNKQTRIYNQDRPASLFESIIRLIIFSCFVFVFQLELQQRNPPDQVVVAIHVAFHLTFPQNIGFWCPSFKRLGQQGRRKKGVCWLVLSWRWWNVLKTI